MLVGCNDCWKCMLTSIVFLWGFLFFSFAQRLFVYNIPLSLSICLCVGVECLNHGVPKKAERPWWTWERFGEKPRSRPWTQAEIIFVFLWCMKSGYNKGTWHFEADMRKMWGDVCVWGICNKGDAVENRKNIKTLANNRMKYSKCTLNSLNSLAKWKERTSRWHMRPEICAKKRRPPWCST